MNNDVKYEAWHSAFAYADERTTTQLAAGYANHYESLVDNPYTWPCHEQTFADFMSNPKEGRV